MELINYQLKSIIFEFYWKHGTSEDEVNEKVKIELSKLIYKDLERNYRYIEKEQLLKEVEKIYSLYDFINVQRESNIFPLNVTYKATPRMLDYTFIKEDESWTTK